MKKVSKNLYTWYQSKNYDFPWRMTNDVYKIWISEIMLQQTQVSTVINYYNNWIEKFPNIKILANSQIDDVLKSWEGLGYYRRAHNIHETAKIIMCRYNGQFPSDFNILLKLKGVGDYTASAIMSIGYNKAYPAIDGNLKRVVARLAGIEDFKNIVNKSKDYVQQLMFNGYVSEINQSLMDLGREICFPKDPKCRICPVKNYCFANKNNAIEKFTIKNKSNKKPIYDVSVGMIWKKNKILISKRKKDGLLGGLWELPGGKKEKKESFSECLEREIYEELNINVQIHKTIGVVKHHYSHFGINMKGYHCNFKSGKICSNTSDGIKWIDLKDIEKYPFPKATLKLFDLAGC